MPIKTQLPQFVLSIQHLTWISKLPCNFTGRAHSVISICHWIIYVGTQKDAVPRTSAWWAQPPAKGGKKSVPRYLLLRYFALFLENIQKLRSGDKMERAGPEVGGLAAEKAAGQTHPISPSLSLALIHTCRGEKWLIINHLSQKSPKTSPNRYAMYARKENTELINLIFIISSLFMSVWITIFAWLCISHGFFLPCLLIKQCIMSTQWCCLRHEEDESSFSFVVMIPRLLLRLSRFHYVAMIRRTWPSTHRWLFCLSASHHIY